LKLESSLGRSLAVIEPFESVRRFLDGYGRVTTQVVFGSHLMLHFIWLWDVKGVRLNPDELAADNLKCIFESSARVRFGGSAVVSRYQSRCILLPTNRGTWNT
jgi:hypothetical protein